MTTMKTQKRNQPTAKQSGLTMFLELARLYPINTVAGKLLILYYASRCDRNGRFHPGYETICKETGLSDETVRVYNKAFKNAGILSWAKGFKNQHMEHGIPNRYQLNPVEMRRVIESSTPNQSGMLEESSTPDSQGSTPDLESSTPDLTGSTPNQSGGKEQVEGTNRKKQYLKDVPPPFFRDHIDTHESASECCAAPVAVLSTQNPKPELTPRQKLEAELARARKSRDNWERNGDPALQVYVVKSRQRVADLEGQLVAMGSTQPVTVAAESGSNAQ
jgi:hypothetical protein